MATKRQLEIFLSVAEHGSMRMAADYLGISQPSVSKHIRALEQHLGGELFLRQRGARVELSETGYRLRSEALELVTRHEAIAKSAHARVAPKTVTVYIRSFLFGELEDVLAAATLEGLETELKFEIVSYDQEVEDLVADHDNSVGLFRSTNIRTTDELDATIIKADECYLYAAPEYVAQHVREETFLPSFRVFVPERGPLTKWVEFHLETVGLESEHWEGVPWFPGAIMRKVLRGDAASLFFESHAQPYLEEGKLERLPVRFGTIYVHLVANKKVPHQVQSAFCKILTDRLAT